MFVSLLPSLHSCTVHVHHPKENSTSSRKSDVSFCQQGSSHNKVCFKAFLLFFRKCFQLTLVYICNTFVLKLNVLCGRLFHFATNGLSCEKFVYSVRSLVDVGYWSGGSVGSLARCLVSFNLFAQILHKFKSLQNNDASHASVEY